jgi:hypothetical protein
VLARDQICLLLISLCAECPTGLPRGSDGQLLLPAVLMSLGVRAAVL